MHDARQGSARLALSRKLHGLGLGARSLARNASYLGAAFVLTYAARALYILLLARILGPELYGVLAFAQSWYVTFLPLALFGVGSVLGRELGRRGSGVRAMLDVSLALRLLSVALAALSCLAIGWWGAPGTEHRAILTVFSLALMGRGVALWSHHVFIGVEQSRFALQQDRLFRPLEVAVGLGLVWLGHGVLSLAIVHAVTWWLQAFQGIYVVRARLFPVVPRWEYRRLLALARSGAPVAVGGVFAGWLVTGPLILYARQEGVTPGLVGQLALAMQICSVLYGLLLSASNAAVPILSRSVARGDGKHVRFLWVIAAGALLIGGSASLIAAAVGQALIRAAFGESFAQAGALLAVALALLIPLTVASAAFQVLIAQERSRSLIVSTGLGAIALSVTLPWLVSQLGPVGAIAAAGGGASLWAITALALAHGGRNSTGVDG